MNTIRILSLALLAGVGVAGAVWYIWGVVENIGALRKQRATNERDSSREITDETENEDADSMNL